MNKKAKKKFLLRTSILSTLVVLFGSSIGFSTNTVYQISKVSNELNSSKTARVSNNYKLNTDNAANGWNEYRLLKSDGTDSGIGVKVPNFSNTSSSEAQLEANTILKMYQSLPSTISTKSKDNPQATNPNFKDLAISDLITVDSSKWQTEGTSSVKVFNLSSYSTYKDNYQNNISNTSNQTPTEFSNLSIDNSLPAFNDLKLSDDETQQVTENLLDSLGILCLQITVTAKSATTSSGWESFYLMIPGFGGSLSESKIAQNNVMLPTNYYSSGVGSVSNSDLVSYLLSVWQTNKSLSSTYASIPTISISSRKNNANTGQINFTSTFSFSTNISNSSGLSFKDSFAGVVDSATTSLTQAINGHISVDNSSNVYNTNISYDRNFVSSGFQPSPAVSNSNVLIITVVIIGVITAICALAFVASTYSRKIRFKNSM